MSTIADTAPHSAAAGHTEPVSQPPAFRSTGAVYGPGPALAQRGPLGYATHSRRCHPLNGSAAPDTGHDMIDIRKLKELVKLMVENDLTELDLQDKEETVALRRGQPETVGIGQPVVHAAPPPPPPPPAPAPASPAISEPTDDGLIAIESPMVGTFYSAPNPDSDPFIKVGDSVGPDTVVCLVEAMKVFNEIKAETTGTVQQCLVESGQAVEFGQKLFLIKPN